MMIIYVCPYCQTPGAQMRLSNERMEPTAEQRAAHPEHDLIGHEILVCTCGEPLTWYDLTPVTRYESFAEGMIAGIIPDGVLRLHEWAKQMQPNESANLGIYYNFDGGLKSSEEILEAFEGNANKTAIN